ncbi:MULTISPECIES: glycerol-3-phosphate 1-O-acyltransferase PlsY [Fusobacterium]|uniref:glycerol-3-phosphate 1-O-acyltransferase PlsY n=1 Tax=Fusobacterium TaxID=848 RepID=UPI001F500813|nr:MULTISPECIES: glycerol-3-phosphate 1-O-acyltransferase PlsY [Fusobacterium]MDD7391908.1 glycerol-3-phosphate 1-O-acyltransferase PlsY [Fusobacteriaceae bacterium]MCI5724409.1 glycerol-3-phosphate 1-O-acyltransferase PlsY [Fusobacterium sp.]MCI7224472.1 glycerol-3-phosphate 1-O-acyltransferase PlsY [Fusobacterium sp.]MDY5306643.1 glycerol-3-phosphate 1-O-acyltransferase PlsY [Fusobacterium gastrosuis]MDY5794477.1 glycerol-3-phosphate 1-O-acyltransferase PlsY [Fusobacterium gastrosuis]
MNFIIMLILCYFAGAIPSGVWIGKIFKGIDVRDYGSKNSGATNCYRVMGAKLGIAVLVVDILKGFLPMLIASKYVTGPFQTVFLGMVIILAHTYSCFINFKGGKGVATSLGVFLFLAPYVILVLILVFFTVFAMFRYVSLASIISAGALPILVFIMDKSNNIYLFVLSLIIGVFVIYRHKTNIERLYRGTETKFKFK